MLKQTTLFSVFTLLLLLISSCQKSADSPAQPPSPTAENVFQREMPHFSKRLKAWNTYVGAPGGGAGGGEFFRKTTYFYDAQGRVDSLWFNANGWGTGSKIVYAADGRVEKYLQYDDKGKLNARRIYTYNAKGLVESWRNEGSLHQKNFEYNESGFLTLAWYSNGDDKTVFTLENSNPVKVQRFYNHDGKEHYLSVAKFDEGWNPLYLAGLYDVFPGEHTPNNQTFGQIVHWDCADYDGSPRTRKLTYDAEGLLLKVEDTLGDYREEYIYE